MAWLRGEKLVAEPPQAPTPLARPDPPPAPEPEVRADRVEPEARVDRARTEPKPKKGLPKRPKVVTPTEGGMGQLELTCVPGTCEIEIDGMATGVAPLKSLTLAPGTHRVHATNRQVNLYKVSTVEIVAGQTTKKNVNLVTDL
jgi:hypothetical protein